MLLQSYSYPLSMFCSEDRRFTTDIHSTMSNKRFQIASFLLFTTLFLCSIDSAVAQKQVPVVDISSPYHSLLTQLYFLQEDSYDPAKAAKVIPNSADSTQRVKWTIRLKKIYDGKGLFVYLNKVPENATYRDSLSQRNVYTPFPHELPGVYLEKNLFGWQYSAETMRNIDEIYREAFPYGTHLLIDSIDTRGGRKFLGLSTWQYLGLVILFFLAIIAYFVLDWFLRVIVFRLVRKHLKLSEKGSKLLKTIVHLLSVFLCIFLIKIVLPVIQLPIQGSKIVILCLVIAIKIIWIAIFFHVIGLIAEYLQFAAEKTETKLDDQFVPLLTKIVKIVIVVIGIMSILKSLNVNITALIAGVSIGGLALALAAQDTVKNLIGSVMIFIDKPFQVGHYIMGSGFEGTVREVGFRTTRIETADTSIIAVPNGSIVNDSVTNLGVRRMRLFKLQLSIAMNTPTHKIELFIFRMKEYLRSDPKINPDNILVNLTAIKDSSLSILIRSHLLTADYAEELQIKEGINLAVLKITQDSSIELAYPTQTIHLQKD